MSAQLFPLTWGDVREARSGLVNEEIISKTGSMCRLYPKGPIRVFDLASVGGAQGSNHSRFGL